MDTLKYPIGKYQAPQAISAAQRSEWIEEISTLPNELAAVVTGLDKEQLDTPYRDGGWTVRQVVHHVADSHMNSVMRFRLALTEDVPLVRSYDEKLWAELPDARQLPVDSSLNLLAALHARWTELLRHMTESHYQRPLRHPDLGVLNLDWMLGLYAWHGRHHVAHIARLGDRLGWT